MAPPEPPDRLACRANAQGDELPQFEGTLDLLESGLRERAALSMLRPADPDERAAFGKSDDVREFGFLLLQMLVLPSSQAGTGAHDDALSADCLTALRLRSLCDGPFMLRDIDGDPTDGVDIAALRDYLDADETLRVGGAGGVDVLDAVDGAGWDLLSKLLAGPWQERPSAAEALEHPFWRAALWL